MVQTALNWLVDNYPGLAECLSSVNRVAALLQALDELDRDDEQQMDPMAVSGSRMPRTAHLPAVCQYSVGQAEEVVALRTEYTSRDSNFQPQIHSSFAGHRCTARS